MDVSDRTHSRAPWNEWKLIGQKAPLKVKNMCAIRVRLRKQGRIRDLAEEPPAVQVLLGHTQLESTVRYLGVEVDDAHEIAEQTEV